MAEITVCGTPERLEEREGEGTSELRWQIKVGCVHTKKDSLLQTSNLVFSSAIGPSANSPFISLLSSLPGPCVGGVGVWPLSGGERHQQPGLLPQRCPGAASSAAFQGQHGGNGPPGEECRGTPGHASDFGPTITLIITVFLKRHS